MQHIIPNIMFLLQYVETYRQGQIKLDHCLHCGRAHPWAHGAYPRESDREHTSSDSLNPVLIQRYYCSGCGKTCSVLPECIPPRRWYLWKTQQAAISLILLGSSARSAEKQVKPSRRTIKRWYAWLKLKFKVYKDVLSSHFPELGLCTEEVSFWRFVFEKLSLSTAMRLCHVAEVAVP